MENDNKRNPIVNWIKWRIEKNKNVIIIVNGATGSGKTYTCINAANKVAQKMETHFSIKNNMAFKFSELLKKTELKINQKPGTCFIFEEVGAFGGGASSRQWQSKANMFFNSFLQTTRHRQQVLFMTTPFFTFLDSASRKLCHMQVDMVNINFKSKLSYARPFVLQVNSKTGKIYFKLLRIRVDGTTTKLSIWTNKLPPQDMIDIYEKIKNKYTTQLTQTIKDLDDTPTNKICEKKIDEKMIFEQIKNKIPTKVIMNVWGCAQRTVERYKQKYRQTLTDTPTDTIHA